MQFYQIDVSVSDKGIVTLPMPHLYNKKVKLVIIPTEDDAIKSDNRKQAMERLIKKQEAMTVTHVTDEDLDYLRYEYLKEKYL